MSGSLGTSLPMYFPAGFEHQRAKSAAKLSLYAYKQYSDWVQQCYPDMNNFQWKPSLDGFSFYDVFFWSYETTVADYRCELYGVMTFQEPIGFVAVEASSNVVYVVFRGTSSTMDELYDGYLTQVPYGFAGGYGLVHSGFHSIYTQLSPLVRAAVNRFVTKQMFVVTGHSLGAALASLAVPDIITNTSIKPGMGGFVISQINFGSPRVGDSDFATSMNTNKVPTYRVVNTEDIVPDAPLAVTPGSIYYKHIGTPVDYTAQYRTDDGNHSMQYSYKYAIENADQPQGPPPPLAPFGTKHSFDLAAASGDVTVARVSKGAPVPSEPSD